MFMIIYNYINLKFKIKFVMSFDLIYEINSLKSLILNFLYK